MLFRSLRSPPPPPERPTHGWVELALNGTDFGPCDTLLLDLWLGNGGAHLEQVNLHVALEAGGNYYFLSTWPSFPTFGEQPCPFRLDLEPGLEARARLLAIPLGQAPPVFSGTFYACLQRIVTGDPVGEVSEAAFTIGP